MAVLANNFTASSPMTTPGRTGVQSLKMIPAPRVFVKSPDSQTAAPLQAYFQKCNGQTPLGWTDMGSIDGMLTVNYEQKMKEVRTGIDNVLQGSYIQQKGATMEAKLAQVDDIVMETLTGVTASVIVPGSIISYPVGTTDVNQLACLFVIANKWDGKEWHFYNPNAFISWSFEQSGDYLNAKLSGILPGFTPVGAVQQQFLSTTIFA